MEIETGLDLGKKAKQPSMQHQYPGTLIETGQTIIRLEKLFEHKHYDTTSSRRDEECRQIPL